MDPTGAAGRDAAAKAFSAFSILFTSLSALEEADFFGLPLGIVLPWFQG